jgi:hypothetical protein
MAVECQKERRLLRENFAITASGRAKNGVFRSMAATFLSVIGHGTLSA